MNSIATIIVFTVRKISFMIVVVIFPVKKIIEISLIIMILAYSAIKIRAKDPLLYSVLKPDTSSDSPSAKSNGVRFVSARVVVNQMYIRGRNIKVVHDRLLVRMKFMSRDLIISSVDKRIKAILTS